MPRVIGVSFKKTGKVYYFGPKDLDIKEGDHVVTVTARGSKLGYVIQGPKDVTDDEIVGTLKDVERVATPADIEKDASHREREEEAMIICQEKIEKHGLPMELLDAEMSFDETMITFSFSADGRVDFRELVKDIAAALHLKIQLLQIGVRDKAKLVGGYGSCGQRLCCNRFLTNFDPVSMKMAKDQSLFLNPAKFSGCCGKLMCCLKFEHEYYSKAGKNLPSPGAILKTDQGEVKVKDYNIISNTVILENEEGAMLNMPIAKVVTPGVCKKHGIHTEQCNENCECVTKEELDYLDVYNIKETSEENIITSATALEGKSMNFDTFKGLLDDDEEEVKESPNNKNKGKGQKKDKSDDKSQVTKKGGDRKGPKPFKMSKDNFSELGITFRDVEDTTKEPLKKQTFKPRPFNHSKGGKRH